MYVHQPNNKAIETIEIIEGRTEYSMSNKNGPDLAIDLSELFEYNLAIDMDRILSRELVPRSFKPLDSELVEKFTMMPKLKGYVLGSGEEMRLRSNQDASSIDVASYEKNMDTTCYLAIIRGFKTNSELNIKMKHTIKYWAASSEV